MNLNEECLLHFLKNPNGLDKTLEELKNYIFSKEKNIIKQNFKTYIKMSDA